MKKDIENIDDVKLLIDSFYKKVVKDETIGYFFNEVVKLDWDKHIPVMYQFWDTVLFGSMSYKGSPIMKHIEMDKKSKLERHHFEQWVRLWKQTVDELFAGTKAEEAKERVTMMQELMLYKIEQSRNSGFVQ